MTFYALKPGLKKKKKTLSNLIPKPSNLQFIIEIKNKLHLDTKKKIKLEKKSFK